MELFGPNPRRWLTHYGDKSRVVVAYDEQDAVTVATIHFGSAPDRVEKDAHQPF